MLFKGTKKRPTGKAISAIIDSRGGDFNAGTDKEITNFYVQLGAQDGPVAVDVIHDIIQNPLFRNQDMNKERAVIQEEISTYDNDPEAQIWDLSDSQVFSESALGKAITGTRQSVCFPNETLRDFYGHYYKPRNMMVVLSGAVNEDLKNAARRKFKTLRGKDLPEKVDTTPVFKNGFAFRAGKTDRVHLHVSFPGVAKDSLHQRRLDLLMMILGGYSSARLYQSLREDKGLCYSVYSYSINQSDSGSLVAAMSLEKEKFEKSLYSILKEVQNLRKDGITKEEFKNAKSSKLGLQSRILDSSMHTAMDVLYQRFQTGEYTEPDSDTALYQATKFHEVQDVIRDYLKFSQFQVSVVGPAEVENQVRKTYESVVKKFHD